MKEIGRRSFFKVSALGVGVLAFGKLAKEIDLTTPSLPEKDVLKDQGVFFIMLDSFKTQEIEKFENSVGHRVHGLSFFADLDEEMPSGDLISKTFSSGREIMFNLMPRKTDNPRDESLFSVGNFLEGRHDKALEQLSKTFSSFGEIPIYVRFGFEMNGGWFSWGGKPSEYKQIFRYVVDRIRDGGAGNVKWIFSPNSFPSPHDMDKYYPGGSYIDLVGTDFYEKSIWSILAPRSSFNRANYYLKSIAPEKPLVVGEIGAAGPGRDGWLTDAVYGNLRQGAGIINYFQIDKEEDWKLDNPDEIPEFRKLVGSGVFLHDNATLEEINSAIMKVY